MCRRKVVFLRFVEFCNTSYTNNMIIQLEGIIKFKTDKFVVLDVSGVGYRVFVSFETLREISGKKDKILLWTHMAVRENSMDLYGFLNYGELGFFESLIQVSGIGPKSAISVLSVASLDTLKRAISTGETSYLTNVSGIGQKLAEKIIVELRDKIGALEGEHNSEAFKKEEEALEALRSLGYSLRESREALRAIPEDIEGTGNRIKEALKNMKC